MTCCIANTASYTAISMLTAMSLCIVLDEFQIILLAECANLVCISITAIKVNNSYCLGLGCDGCLYEVV